MLRLPALLAVLLLSVVLAACGGENRDQLSPAQMDRGETGDAAGAVLAGEQENTYLELGGLKYQTQISRQLNEYDVEDRDYLVGLTDEQLRLTNDQVWFAVFIRVENDHTEPARSSSDFTIVDTQEQRYRPLILPETNVWRYHPAVLQPGELIPTLGSTAFLGPTQGALLLFKIDRRSYENRPLELVIGHPTTDQVAMTPLDV